jgi:hypothetical protein
MIGGIEWWRLLLLKKDRIWLYLSLDEIISNAIMSLWVIEQYL